MLKINLRCAAKDSQFGSAYGYGRTYRSFAKHLQLHGEVELVDDDYPTPDIQVVMCYPHKHLAEWVYYARKRRSVQVIYTTWETTAIPIDWAEVMNTRAAVFTPSTFSVKVFRDNGVKAPIYWTPNGVDAEEFPRLERDYTGSESSLWPDKRFIFLWQGMHPADRKGMIYAQQAFSELLADGCIPDSWLVEKWYPVASAPFGPMSYPDRKITQFGQILEKQSYLDLLAASHVSVNPFRGESPGQMPLETASTGMYTIATNWSGATDYLHPEYFRPLKYTLCEPGESFVETSPYNDIILVKKGQDALPDIGDLKAAMLWAYENREQAAKIGMAASAWVQKNWNWHIAADEMVKACKRVLRNV